MSEKICIACEEFLEMGFVPEQGVGGFFTSVWHPGHPDTQNKSFKEKLASPAGVRFEKDKVLVMEAWRCKGCGRVELFANRAPEKGEIG